MKVSFEVFPPKKDGDFNSAFEVVGKLSRLQPELISVTYGAGGSQSKKTLEIASYVQNKYHVPAMAHMTCVGSRREEIKKLCEEFMSHGVSRVLALRGDRPKTMTDEQFDGREFIYATDLIRYLKENTGLHVWGACYPETHYEAESPEDDLRHMKEKQEAGVEAFITQMFFDNNCYYRFREQTERIGITAPIHVGIMPITTAKQLGTTVSLSGATIPKALSDLIAEYGDKPKEMYQAGIDYAIGQILNLKEHGVEGIHIYTMNRPEIAEKIVGEIF